MPDDGGDHGVAVHAARMAVPESQQRDAPRTWVRHVEVRAAVHFFDERILPLRQTSDQLLNRGVVDGALLRVAQHLGDDPRAGRYYGRSVHLVRIDFTRIMSRTAIARD